MAMKLYNWYKTIQASELSRRNLGRPLLAHHTVMIRERALRKIVPLFRTNRYGFTSAAIETVGSCNRTCDFCFNAKTIKKRAMGVMKEELWNKIMDELGESHYTGRISPYFYGEPLLDKRLPRLVAYARKQCPHAWISINTNGDYLTEALLRDLVEAGINHLLVTNYDEERKPDLEALALKCPFYVTLRSYHDFDKVNRAGGLFPEKRELKVPCMRPSNQLVVNWNGDVALCCNDFYAKQGLGNLATQSIMDIWYSERFENFRSTLKLGQRSKFDICRFCDQT